MEHKDGVNQTAPVYGAVCRACGVASRLYADHGRVICGCVSGAEADWKYGVDDQSEWYRAADQFSWRQLSAAAARMQHAKDADATVKIRCVARAPRR